MLMVVQNAAHHGVGLMYANEASLNSHKSKCYYIWYFIDRKTNLISGEKDKNNNKEEKGEEEEYFFRSKSSIA